jgi:lipoprotein-anchoring transpeptidase ErfK/SrfK
MRRIGLILAIVLTTLVAPVACARPEPPAPLPVAPPKKPAVVAYEPGTGVSEVNPTASISVRVADGTVVEVALRDAGDEAVDGALSPDRTRWTASEPLAYGQTYTWSGRAIGDDGTTVALQGGFSTLQPARQLRGSLNIGDGKTVGVAAPITIKFDGHVENRAAVERALWVQTAVPVEGAWAWLPDQDGGSRVHYRTKEYWPANTQVTVTAKLYGVDYGGGAYGRADVSSSFTVGRAQIVKADVNSHELVVLRDGAEVARYPASYGLASDPVRNTRSGIHVVTEKFSDKRMTSDRYGYDVVVQWAVRMNNNGEFIHAMPGTIGQQGSRNVTHGCVNLSTANAKAYYETVLYGDPVEVSGSSVPLSAQDGDIWDWTVPWEQWRELSAL